MSRPIRATISPAALRHNYAAAKRAAPRSRVYAVVKANAYGHGIERVARALGAGADGFATLELDGALSLREQFPAAPCCCSKAASRPPSSRPRRWRASRPSCTARSSSRMLEANRLADPVDAWLKINTGMNRLGFAPAAARAAYARLEKCGNVRAITLMTHFAISDARRRHARGDARVPGGHARASTGRAASPTPPRSSRIRSRTPTSAASASGSTAPRPSPSGPRRRSG